MVYTKGPLIRGGSLSQPRRGPTTKFVRETKREEYATAASPPNYDIDIVKHFELDLHKLFSKHSSTWFNDIFLKK